ncbi:MAG: phosphate/phosphite/phosphonate ABC transporter substrate-binding protein [Chloroflexi bacterium]|nr:phosphate/phosphite/phosphonate ABC transporter substrate-binding protein [Chloroflexota bacterium]
MVRLVFVVLAVLFGGLLLGACRASPAPAPSALPTQAAAAQAPTPEVKATKDKLVIAILPTASPEALSAESKELERFLEARTGADVEIVVPTLYGGVIEALRFGHAHAAFLSAWPAALAAKNAGATVALAEVREVVIGQEMQEKPFYFSYWVVRKDSPYRTLSDLKGKKVAFSSPLSTSGYVFPMARLMELGLVDPAGKEPDPKQFFGEVLFAGGYAQAWQALKQGQVDVTIIAGDVSERLYREVLDGTRILEQQGPIPSHAVVFGKELREPLRSKLQEALLELGTPENRPLMRKFISGIFVRFQATSTEEHLSGLSKALDLTRLAFTESLR